MLHPSRFVQAYRYLEMQFVLLINYFLVALLPMCIFDFHITSLSLHNVALFAYQASRQMFVRHQESQHSQQN